MITVIESVNSYIECKVSGDLQETCCAFEDVLLGWVISLLGKYAWPPRHLVLVGLFLARKRRKVTRT